MTIYRITQNDYEHGTISELFHDHDNAIVRFFELWYEQKRSSDNFQGHFSSYSESSFSTEETRVFLEEIDLDDLFSDEPICYNNEDY